MTFFYCWHRPGRRIQAQRYACRHCGVAIEECPGVSWRNSCVGGSTCPCEGSGWVAIVRSKRQALAQTLMASNPYGSSRSQLDVGSLMVYVGRNRRRELPVASQMC